VAAYDADVAVLAKLAYDAEFVFDAATFMDLI
jgi:hypothetical protein